MTSITRAEAIAELRGHECTDAIQQQAIERACHIMAQSEFGRRLDGLDLVVLDPAQASPGLRESSVYTENCRSLLYESLVIINLRFLAELEGALRAFANAGSFYGMPQIRSDEAMFGLVRDLRPPLPDWLARRVTPDPWPHLNRMRRLTSGYGAPSREGDREEDMREELSLVILFFVAHEVGHLLNGKDARGFGAFLPPGADLELRKANAVVRLARHVDDFKRRDHGLPGFEAMTDIDSDVRATVKRMEAELGDAPAQHDAWFKEEDSADQWASRLLDEHLRRVEAEDRHEGARAAYLLCRGIFGAALYGWYADLLSFYDGLGIEVSSNAESLVRAMMYDRHNYIRAASLFGEDHRSTLLRGEIALESVLENRTDWFDHCEWSRSIMNSEGPEVEGAAAQEKWWIEETVLRMCLLGITIDTAVKMAYVGAASSWYEQSPNAPVLLMRFEPIDEAVRHLTRRSS